MLALRKYLLFAFLLENIAVQSSLLGAYTEIFFYSFLVLGALCMLNVNMWKSVAVKKFGWMYALMALYIIYEFVVGPEYINTRTITYMATKIVTFGIIIEGLSTNRSFYVGKGIYWIFITMSFFLIIGLLTGGGTQANGRALAGFTNSNTTGAMGALISGMVLFYMKGRKWSIVPMICLLLGFYGILAGASRAGFMMFGLLVFFRFGVNIKTLLWVGALVFVGLVLLPNIGIQTVGIQRMIDTYEGIEGTNRDVERAAAEWMIAQKPWTGWGYLAVNQGYAAILSNLPSHNGYLETAKQMGIPCAIIYFGIILSAILSYWRAKYRYHQPMNLFFALVLMLLVKANYESSFIGVHEFGTNLFFFALAIISSQTYTLKHKYTN